MRIAQLNVNHSQGAQDFVLQWARESEAALICIAEPQVPQSPLVWRPKQHCCDLLVSAVLLD